MKIRIVIALITAFLVKTAIAQDFKIIQMADLKTKTNIGSIKIEASPLGVIFTPQLTASPMILTPGLHGFHVHQKGSCSSIVKNGKTILGGGAGGHYDPYITNAHGFAWGQYNHKGDLPALYVDASGKAENPVFAPRLTFSELKGLSIMIHMNGDNHSDHPNKLGGGGSRVACGVIE